MKPTESTELTESTQVNPVRVLLEDQCPKLSQRSSGQLTYACGVDDQGDYFVRVSANDASGAFSNEWIALNDITGLINPMNLPFRSTVLVPLFKKRSANNAPFLAAVLRHVGLFLPVDGFPSYSKRGSDMSLLHKLKTLKG